MTDKALKDLQAEVMVAVREYIKGRPVRGMTSGRYHEIWTVIGTFNPEDRGDLWAFFDSIDILRMDDFMADIYRALGSISGKFFWVAVMGYALKLGTLHYTAQHRGAPPEDYSAWLYAILTADDLLDVSKKDF